MTLEATLSTVAALLAGCCGVYLAARIADRRGLSERATDAALVAGFLIPAAVSLGFLIMLSAAGRNPLPMIYARVLEFLP